MEKIWKEIEPFFRLNGSYEFRSENYETDICVTEQLCSDLNVKVSHYLQGVFYPRLSEQLTNFKIRPKHLHSKWALLKFRDWLELGKQVSPTLMEVKFINHSKQHIKKSKLSIEDYLGGNLLIPPCLDDLRKLKISILYCVINPIFKSMYNRLPNDIKDEYFYGIDLSYLGTQTLLYRNVVDAIRN